MWDALHTHGTRLIATIAAFYATLQGGSTFACPSCPVGQVARQQVCEQGLAQNLLIATLPFVAIVFAAAFAERIGKVRR